MHWQDLECQTINPCICNSLYAIPWVAAQAVRWPGIRRSHVRISVSAVSFVICSKHWTMQYVELRGTALCRVRGATSQLDLPSLTPLSIAGCGLLQLRATYWVTSVNYCKQLIIEATFCGSRFSTGRLLAIEDHLFFTAIFF